VKLIPDSHGQELGELVAMIQRRLYLKEVVGQGPRPCRRGGAVAAPHRRGRFLQWLRPSKLSMPNLSCGAPIYRTQEADYNP
jgi:hypothetical protein